MRYYACIFTLTFSIVVCATATATATVTDHDWFAPPARNLADSEIVLLREVATLRAQGNVAGADGDSYDFFGGAVAISGSTLMIGASEDDVHEEDQGSVYVYESSPTGVVLHSKLVAPEATYEGKFGKTMALAGNLAVIGSIDTRSFRNEQVVHIYHRSNGQWVWQQSLASSLDRDRIFGDLVVTDGSRIFVTGSYGVTVYEFDAIKWVETAQLMATNATDHRGFGSAIALRGNTAFIGAQEAVLDGVEGYPGAVYIYEFVDDDWVQQARLTAANPIGGDRFGAALSIEEDILAVGARADGNRFDYRNGFATVFREREGVWFVESTVTADDGATSDRFGQSIAIRSGLLAIGASGQDIDSVFGQGAVYLYGQDQGAWTQSAKITTAAGPFGGGQFGAALALEQGRLLVGARYSTTGDFQSGAAHLFDVSPTGWSAVAQLDAGPGNATANFGSAVALWGDRGLAYSGGRDSAAYVIERDQNEWRETGRLKAMGRPQVNRSNFGVNMALDADTAIIGYPWEQPNDDFRRGAAYLWNLIDGVWIQQPPIIADDGMVNAWFGAAVAVEGDLAVIGAPRASVGGLEDAGAAYIYRRSSGQWQQQQKLLASDVGQYHQFGSSVAINGGTIAVAAAQYGRGSGTLGGVYVFVLTDSAWVEQARIPGTDEGHLFGRAVDIDGDTLLIGSTRPDGSRGAAHVYVRDQAGWTEQHRFTAFGGDIGGFGASVSISGDVALIGSRAQNIDSSNRRGAAFVYRRVEDVWNFVNLISSAASDRATSAGSSVAVDGDTAFVGDSYANGDSPFSNLRDGRVYVYVGLAESIGTVNYTGTYWDATEPGWGVNIAHQGALLFGTWYSYAEDGKVMFLTMEAELAENGWFSGPIYRVQGIPFSSINGGQAFTAATEVGQASGSFNPSGDLVMTATVDGSPVFLTQNRHGRLRRFDVDQRPPICVSLAGSRARSENYSDLWWNPSEAGWGLTLSHQGASIFALWYTYDESGRDQWMSASRLALQPDGSFSGPVERPDSGVPLHDRDGPTTTFPVPEVGSAVLRFSDGERGVFSYSVDGAARATAIERFVAVGAEQARARCVDP